MPETKALPSEDQLILVRADLDDKIPENTTVDDWLNKALLRVKRDLEDKRETKWAQVYDLTTDAYFDNADATGRNQDRIQEMIMLCTSMLVFQNYANTRGDDSEWWKFYESYKEEYTTLLMSARLDIDLDEDGDVDEEGRLGQSFFSK
jgi:hypothetical protein